ncbi:unnamed protein product [Heligmosomoides polygyrus]|uniref:Uncharacterized protein n=1 Tax=Heligmosomoides polygyrus TaxID=6339 RepID=A0A183G1W1_HELPZ|nr:unnamed protein product [Heligmosomoides polygyrus]
MSSRRRLDGLQEGAVQLLLGWHERVRAGGGEDDAVERPLFSDLMSGRQSATRRLVFISDRTLLMSGENEIML